MADKRITELSTLTGPQLDSDVDVLAIADVSAAETKKITPVSLIATAIGALPEGSVDGDVIIDNSISGSALKENSVTSRELAPDSVNTIHVVDGAVTSEKILDGTIQGSDIGDDQINTNHYAPNSVDGDALGAGVITDEHVQPGGIGSVSLAPNSVTDVELADNSVDTAAVQDDSLTTPKYQNASVTNEKLADGIDGNKLNDGSVPISKLDGQIDGSQIGDIGLSQLPDAAANTVLAGPTSGGAANPTYRKLVGDDLPIATDSTKGGVSVPAAGGLTVGVDGSVQIANNVVAATHAVVQYDKNGLITSGRDLQPGDLPAPSGDNPGAVKAGNGITIAPDGTISQRQTGVTPGTYTKVTVDVMGNATVGELLEASDIPNIDYTQIDNILVGSTDLGEKSVQRRHINDYAISFIQEALPTVDNTVHIGCLWFQESTATLHMWNGNSWQGVGIGRLSAENLRYCGIFDPATGNIVAVTQFGDLAGYKADMEIPEATDELAGTYFVATQDGSGTNVLPGASFDGGDWIVCNGATAGWARVDTLSSGGGGGGATVLNDLLDVEALPTETGAFLTWNATTRSSRWVATTEINCGTFLRQIKALVDWIKIGLAR